jgi:tripartite ATP-independent transporter DctP family solute receptor
MKERSGGELQMDVIADGQLGSDKQIFEQMRTNEVQIHVGGPTVIHNLVREYQCMEAEWVFDDEEHGYRVWLGSLGKEVKAQIEKRFGISILGVAKAGARVVSIKKPIHAPGDFKGVKMRVTNQLRGEVFGAFGALPVPLPIAEVYGGLQQGTIDAAENGLSSIYGNRFQEISRYLIETNHNWKYWVFSGATEFINGLTPAQRKVFDETLVETVAWANKESGRFEIEIRGEMEKSGVAFIRPDVEAMKKIAAPVVQKFAASNCRPGLLEEIASYR